LWLIISCEDGNRRKHHQLDDRLDESLQCYPLMQLVNCGWGKKKGAKN